MLSNYQQTLIFPSPISVISVSDDIDTNHNHDMITSTLEYTRRPTRTKPSFTNKRCTIGRFNILKQKTSLLSWCSAIVAVLLLSSSSIHAFVVTSKFSHHAHSIFSRDRFLPTITDSSIGLNYLANEIIGIHRNPTRVGPNQRQYGWITTSQTLHLGYRTITDTTMGASNSSDMTSSRGNIQYSSPVETTTSNSIRPSTDIEVKKYTSETTKKSSNNQQRSSQRVDHHQDKLDLNLLLIDNYDSYTYNLYSYLSNICLHPPTVLSNDAYGSWDELMESLDANAIDGIIISPGPGRPDRSKDIGICLDAIKNNPNLPILGVCLGHQALGHFYKPNSVSLAKEGPVHGLTSKVWYKSDYNTSYLSLSPEFISNEPTTEQLRKDDKVQPQCNLFDGIPQHFDVVRYHSLVVNLSEDDVTNGDLPIEPIAWCYGSPLSNTSTSEQSSTTCMSLRHKQYPHYGVQFHPESIGTEDGYKLLQNFCNFCEEWRNTDVDIDPNDSYPINLQIDENNESFMEEMNLKTDASTKGQKYQVLIHKINSSALEGDNTMPRPDVVFQEIYSSLENSFWLDSSTGRKDADKDETFTKSAESDGCPIVRNSRFSIMGGDDGPLCEKLHYYGHDFPVQQRGLNIISKNGDENYVNKTTNDGILSYIRARMSQDSVTREFVRFASSDLEESTSSDFHFTLSNCEEVPFDFAGGYVGYLGYEVRHDTRRSICDQEICKSGLDDSENSEAQLSEHNRYQSDDNVPTASFLFADRSLVYDHWREEWYAIALHESYGIGADENGNMEKDRHLEDSIEWMHQITQDILSCSSSNVLPVVTKSQMINDHQNLEFTLARSKEQYTKDIAVCHEQIKNGESYELCLTNQLSTQVPFIVPEGSSTKDMKYSPFGLYKKLRRKNPAPFSAFLQYKSDIKPEASISICCSSPERFISVHQKDSQFTVESKPIKGTCSRKILVDEYSNVSYDVENDSIAAEDLRLSVKNRAENLMIVDLLRNDLSRVCEPGSVHVPKLMEVESFATVHQLVSTIRGTLDRETRNSVDVLSACFPGGSMTGAPKLRSVDILDRIELGKSRGPYSGCLGYISVNGCMDMNIIIRTAVVTSSPIDSRKQDLHSVMQGENLLNWNVNIGAGGAITALSESDDEFDEMMLKARAIKESVVQWYNEGKKGDI